VSDVCAGAKPPGSQVVERGAYMGTAGAETR